jgi:hypothetical protein
LISTGKILHEARSVRVRNLSIKYRIGMQIDRTFTVLGRLGAGCCGGRMQLDAASSAKPR